MEPSGVGQAGSQPEVGDEVQHQEEAGVDKGRAGDLLLAGGVDAEESDCGQHRHREQVQELAEARCPHGPARSAFRTAALASDSERMRWSNSCLRVAALSEA